MKKLMIKFLCLIMPLSLFKPCVLADDSGYIWLEAEDQQSSMPTCEDSSASGGAMLKANYLNYSDDDYLNVDFEYEISSADIYDVWALIQVPPGGHISSVYFSLDDDALVKYNSGDNNFQPVPVYQSEVWGVNFDVSWVKVTSRNLSKGTHTLQYALEDIREIGHPEKFNGMIDCITIVPAAWEWLPTDDLNNKPENTVNRIGSAVWIEGENGIITEGKADIKTGYTGEKLSDSKFLYGRYNYSKAPVKAEYDFKINESEQYDVWALMNEQNSGLWGKWEMNLNGKTSSSCDKQIELTASMPDNEHNKPIYWQRIYSGIHLEEGLSELDFCVNEDSVNGYAMFMLDCIAVVPSSMQWQPKADVSPIVSAMEIDMQTLMEIYFNNTEKIVKTDLSFPAGSEKLPCSSKFSIESDNLCISPDGAVTRPDFSAEDALVNIEVKLLKDGYEISNTIPYTVKKNDKYLCEAFNIFEESGTVKAKARVKLSGSEGNGLEGSAVLVICMYNDGVLEKIAYENLTLSNAYTDIESELEMPQNSKYSVRAFLLSDWNVAAEISESICL